MRFRGIKAVKAVDSAIEGQKPCHEKIRIVEKEIL